MIDGILRELAPFSPDLRNGFTNHAPMVVEALVTLGRENAVRPWFDRYKAQFLPKPPPTIATTSWKEFFDRELRQSSWTEVLCEWLPRLLPAFCASANHGVIRTGHAVRSLTRKETPERIAELAEGLGYWAAEYQTLPEARPDGPPLPARQAIRRVPLLPASARVEFPSIVAALRSLDGLPGFGSTRHFLEVSGSPESVLSELSETFARVFLANARNSLTAIVFVHGVTGIGALRSILPHLPAGSAEDALRHAWQASCGLYAVYGNEPDVNVVPDVDAAALVDRAIACGDEHAIKFTEVCLREYALNPSPAYPAAADLAIGLLSSSSSVVS